jgi:penicillin-binding protein 1A
VVMAKSIGLEKACVEIEVSLQNHPVCSGPALIGGARGSEATPLHMAEAYSAFVNGGTRVAADFVGGEAEVKKTTRLFSPQAAYQELQMMRSVIGDAPAERATAAMARVWSELPKGAQIAGKTGTDGENKFWIGVAQPRLIVIVLISVPSQTALHERDGFTGGMTGGRVWADFVRRSLQRSPYYFSGTFSQPDGVEWLEIDRARGCLQPGTKDNEIFMVARVPRSCF